MAASAIPSSLYIFVVQNGYQYLLSDLYVDLLQTWYLRPMSDPLHGNVQNDCHYTSWVSMRA